MPRHATRVFLDANVLFSAAYRDGASLMRLWELDGVTVITSSYAAVEAARNLSTDGQRKRLETLLTHTELTDATAVIPLPSDVRLPSKDRPILQAAITADADYLLTGDRTHFGDYYETTIAGVTILPPAAFFLRRS